MEIRRRIKKLPLSAILIPEVELRYNRRRQIYAFTLCGELIYEFPEGLNDNEKVDFHYFVHSYLSELHRCLRGYIDTPRDQLLDFSMVDKSRYVNIRTKAVAEILKASDRRIGIDRLSHLLFTTNYNAVREIISYRLSQRGSKKNET